MRRGDRKKRERRGHTKPLRSIVRLHANTSRPVQHLHVGARRTGIASRACCCKFNFNDQSYCEEHPSASAYVKKKAAAGIHSFRIRLFGRSVPTGFISSGGRVLARPLRLYGCQLPFTFPIYYPELHTYLWEKNSMALVPPLIFCHV
jgi:hypothetical protein